MVFAPRGVPACVRLLACCTWAAGAAVASAGLEDATALLQGVMGVEAAAEAALPDGGGYAAEDPVAIEAAREDMAEMYEWPLGGRASRQEHLNVLVFLAVGSSDKTATRLRRNIANLKKYSRFFSSTVFLAHYDLKQSNWLARDAWWYKSFVDFSVQEPGYKFQIARKVLPKHLAQHKYDWVWLVDEDVDFHKTPLRKLFTYATHSQALVAQPAVIMPGGHAEKANASRALFSNTNPATQSSSHSPPALSALQVEGRTTLGCQPNEAMCHHTAPHDGCLFRYANMVEVMATLIRPEALLTVFKDCTDCMHEKTLWGLDLMWCSWLAQKFSKDKSTTCAVVDEATIRHENQKTLDKWDDRGNRNMQVVNSVYWSAWHKVKDKYPQHFISDFGHTIKCVKTLSG